MKKKHLDFGPKKSPFFALESDPTRKKKAGGLMVGFGHSRLTVTVTVVECDIVPLFAVTVIV